MAARAQVLLQTCRAVHWTQSNACTPGRDEGRRVQHPGDQVRTALDCSATASCQHSHSHSSAPSTEHTLPLPSAVPVREAATDSLFSELRCTGQRSGQPPSGTIEELPTVKTAYACLLQQRLCRSLQLSGAKAGRRAPRVQAATCSLLARQGRKVCSCLNHRQHRAAKALQWRGTVGHWPAENLCSMCSATDVWRARHHPQGWKLLALQGDHAQRVMCGRCPPPRNITAVLMSCREVRPTSSQQLMLAAAPTFKHHSCAAPGPSGSSC